MEYKRITEPEDIRALRLTKNDKGAEYGSSRFKGQTFDVVIDDKYIRRVTFGILDFGKSYVAVISEIIKNEKRESRVDFIDPMFHKQDSKGDFIDHLLNQSAYENGWD